VRRLAETDDIMASGAALHAAFRVEQRRVETRVNRLTRSRNAAIHGGPLSEVACATIANSAVTLACQALNITIGGIMAGRPLNSYAASRRDEFRQRIHDLTLGGDLTNLFRLAS
jgi:hypothetical protein